MITRNDFDDDFPLEPQQSMALMDMLDLLGIEMKFSGNMFEYFW